MFRSAVRVCALLALAATLPACDSNDPVVPPVTPPTVEPPVDPGAAFAGAAANRGQWTFIPTGGAKCRDGSDTGFGVRLASEASTNLMIYLEGGGACFSPSTCGGNPSRFGAAEFAGTAQARLNGGIFGTDDSNPVGDWNQVYVPYCTGDVHGGTLANAGVPGVTGAQQFVGHKNIEKYMRLVGPYFGDPDKVLLAGLSAGGFGSLLNFPTVDSTFSGSQTYLLDDSGPIPFDDGVLSPDLGFALNVLFGLSRALPVAGGPDAGAVFQRDGLQNIYSYLASTYPDSRFALASHVEDATIRGFFGFNPATGMNFAISGDAYATALRDARRRLPSQWGTYFAAGATHTFIASPELYNASSGGVALNEYVRQLVNGNVSNVDVEPTRAAPRLVLAAR